MNFYVYVYRDKNANPCYVGYGKTVSRASEHLSGSHNAELNEFLQGQQFTLEVAGPFQSEEVARTVETALISALSPKFNRNLGQTQWRFRPLGVPLEWAKRLDLPPLTAAELDSRPTMLVRIGNQNFEDGRDGYDPAAPLPDSELLERVDKWWQISRYLNGWAVNPEQSPALLLGVIGKPGAQIIIAALETARDDWAGAPCEGALAQVPTNGPANLDAFNLRGRRIDKAAGVKFNSIRSQIFNLRGDVETDF